MARTSSSATNRTSFPEQVPAPGVVAVGVPVVGSGNANGMILSSSSEDVDECLFCCCCLLLFLRSCLDCLRAAAEEDDLFRILATFVFLFWKYVGEIDDEDVQDVTVVDVDEDDKEIESISASQLLSLVLQQLACFGL